MSANNEVLVVPIDLAALCVGVKDQSESGYVTSDFADTSYDYSNLPYQQGGTTKQFGAFINDGVLPQVLGKASNPLEKGIHLHWSLPSSVAHMSVDKEGNQSVREAPNRWYVVRMVIDNSVQSSPVVTQKGWVIESDALWDSADGESIDASDPSSNSKDVPIKIDLSGASNKSFKKMGKVFDGDTWQEGAGLSYAESNTFLGYGLHTFSATYTNSLNVFAFFDNANDIGDGLDVSYMVYGWYSDASNDPLNASIYPSSVTTDVAKINYINNLYKWTIEDNAANTVPSLTVCNGLLTGITWNKSTKYITERTPSLDIAVGNTVSEALSAYLAVTSSITNAEDILNALQLGALTNTATGTGLADFVESIHSSGFEKETPTNIWVIKQDPSGDNKIEPLPESTGDLLNKLNDMQGEYNSMLLDLNSLRGQIFCDFYNYMSLQYPPPPGSPSDAEAADVLTYLEQVDYKYFTELSSQIEVSEKQIGIAVGEIKNKLPKYYCIESVPASRYYSPSNPVLLFHGDAIKPPARYDRDIRSGKKYLSSRLGGKLISEFTVKGITTISISTTDLPAPTVTIKAPYTESLASTIGEMIFLDTNCAPMLAELLASKGETGTTALIPIIETAQEALVTGTSTGSEVIFTGSVPPSMGFNIWSEPWIPIMMEWQVNYYPVNGTVDYAAKFIIDNYTLGTGDNDVDLKPSTDSVPSVNAQVYSGSMLLKDNVEINITNEINNFIKNYPDSQYDAQLQSILSSSCSMQAQGLAGFNAAMLMRSEVLQMPVGDPLAATMGTKRFFNTILSTVIGDECKSSPKMHNNYNPIRGGFMEISNVRIVDAFGQTEVVNITNTIVSSSLSFSGQSTYNIYIPPRITQPSRLNFNYLSASDNVVEMNSVPTTTPICGWILYNHLDDNLAIYDAEGVALGSLNMIGPLFMGAPGDTSTYGKTVREVMSAANPHLKDFVLGVYNKAKSDDGRSYLSDILKVIDITTTVIEPSNYIENTGLSVLMGRPIALVRSTVDLELMGEAAYDQSLNALQAACTSGKATGREDSSFPSVEVPVRIGDLSNINDGLVGYFIEGTTNPFETMYAPASTGGGNGVVVPTADQITVKGEKSSSGVTLSMLVDPRASIHATTGILPVVENTIPPEMYNNALNHIAVTFLTAPILSAASDLKVPLPDETGYDWSWVSLESGATNWTVSDISSTGAKGPFTLLPQKLREGWLKLEKKSS